MKYLITGVIYFIVVFICYYIFIARKQKKQKYKKLSADAMILSKYYKLDLKKIGYKKTYIVLNIINSLLITAISLIVMLINNMVIKILMIVVLIFPMIWFGYFVAYKILSIGGKKDE